jgi:hypothetical protein
MDDKKIGRTILMYLATIAGPERRRVSVDDEPYRPPRGGFAGGFREGVERSRARRAEEEERAREAERHALELERLRLEIERLRRGAEESEAD